MFDDRLFPCRLPPRLLVRTTLLAERRSIPVAPPNQTLSGYTPVFLDPFPCMLCKSSARRPDFFSNAEGFAIDTLHAGENRDFFSPGRSAPVYGKEDAS